MKESKIILKNGNPCLCIGDEQFPACAYITYFEERNEYEAFSNAGFKIYSVSISLASQPINTKSGFMPYERGVFDVKGKADFSSVDETIQKILAVCPNAYIFPRIYVCMPQWWIDENPEETIPVPHNKRRESLYSDKFREDASAMLKILVEHFKNFDAADHIFGYQISGGNTQEWFHLDRNGSYCDYTLPYFNRYLKNKYPDITPLTELPDIEKINTSAELQDKYLTEYLRFASEEVAKTIEILCKATKEAVNYKQIVGVFYGYTAEVADSLWGTHALNDILDSENIDFISSPNSYMDIRALGVDWPDMLPVDSVKLHGKMCFMESDIRTFLSRCPGECREGSDPYSCYTNDVWRGPATDRLSVYAIRKSLARQLTQKHGLWWFDMFGHWYATDAMMQEMEVSLKLYERSLVDTPLEFAPEVALVLDEKTYSQIGHKHPAYLSGSLIRKSLGYTGVPYKFYLMDDFDKIEWENSPFKAVVFGIVSDDNKLQKAISKLSSLGIGSLSITAKKPMYTNKELLGFFKENNVFIFSDSEDVCYFGNGYASIHAVSEGEKEIKFPMAVKCTNIESNQSATTDCLKLRCAKHETQIFRIEKV